eukprot:Skav202640  [mRNA]  locus=scaffold1942:166092:167351:- [translate_table: standard]
MAAYADLFPLSASSSVAKHLGKNPGSCDFCTLKIGVGTLLADDPQLTARLVPGPNPRPMVLDSDLRTPLASTLVKQTKQSNLVLLTTNEGGKEKWQRAKALEQHGVFILEVPAAADRVSLEDALCRIKEDLGCHSVMVEGGMTVIASFLARPELVSNFIMTVSPKFLGGYGPSEKLLKGEPQSLLSMPKMQSCAVGDDIVLYGSPSVPYLNGKSNAGTHKSELTCTQHVVVGFAYFLQDCALSILNVQNSENLFVGCLRIIIETLSLPSQMQILRMERSKVVLSLEDQPAVGKPPFFA